jgi:DNA-binding CsgD family transcriptional regulator
MRDENEKPLLSISLALPLDITHHNTSIVERLQKENDFLRENLHKYSRLTERERDILKLTCLGKSSQEISEYLFISPTTADTHRRNLKKKLGANSIYDLSQFALAFNLI